ncbi:hypothetical protein ACFO3J_17290 [Streptomyces polygonati]|uniref:Secreted protein n=1 Tax=Streptomyces polygonati TaxID=1617087 RepID=A0ABV8HNP0_9ACTN
MRTTPSPRAAPTASLLLLLGLITLLHAVFLPARSHLIAEEANCPRLRAPAAAAAIPGAAHLCPPPAAAATPSQSHPEHDPAARACHGTAGTRAPGHTLLLPAGEPTTPGIRAALQAGEFAAPPSAELATLPAPLRQVLRC